jgi:hypothetical protein
VESVSQPPLLLNLIQLLRTVIWVSPDTDESGCPTTGSLTEISSQELSTDPREITARGGYALVSGIGLSVVDISDPSSTQEIASLPEQEVRGFGHVWLDKYAYMMDGPKEAVIVVDISDLTSPEVIGSLSDRRMRSPRKAAFRNGFLYVSTHDNTNTFVIIDVTDREQPQLVGSVADPNLRGRCQEVALAGNHAFVTNKDNSVVQSIDISEPTAPKVVDSVSLGQPYGLVALDHKLFVSLTNRTDGIAILDITDPTDIGLLAKRTDNPLDSVYGMEFKDGYVYVADKYACHGYHAMRLDSGTKLQVTDSINSPSLTKPYDVSVVDGIAYVVSRGSRTVVAIETHGGDGR